jgi:surfactin synthase thioesterase subunit
VFCLPPAGAGTSTYRNWSALLPSDIDWCPIQLPGRESRFSEALMDEPERLMVALSEALMPWLKRPFALFGYSMGGLIAHAWAQHLRKQGLPQPERLIIAACSSPDTPAGIDPDKVDTCTFIAYLKQLGGTPAEVFEDQELMDLMLPQLCGDFRLVVRLRECIYGSALTQPITALAAEDDLHSPPPAVARWSQHTSGKFTGLTLPGGHFSMLNQPRVLINQMLGALS